MDHTPFAGHNTGEGTFRAEVTEMRSDSWIRVSDRLPADEVLVLVFLPDDLDPVWIGYIDGEVEAWRSDLGGIIAPTHWMPLPDGPEE